jgi:hypothetical protein
MDDNDVHSEKQYQPIEVTEFGIVMDVNKEHLEKQFINDLMDFVMKI